jgi:hypothetical protein
VLVAVSQHAMALATFGQLFAHSESCVHFVTHFAGGSSFFAGVEDVVGTVDGVGVGCV